MRRSAVSSQHSAVSTRLERSGLAPRRRPLIMILILLTLSTLAFAQDKAVALKGGKVLTVSHGVIENGVVVMQGGKITAVGSASSVNIPAGAQVIDTTGMTIYPGLIDSETQLGLTEISAEA